jgi:choline dehydrogenase
VTRGKQCVGVLLDATGGSSSHSSSTTAATRFVASKLETILCAGAVQTPQLLLLSGIGPKDELARVAGVTPVHDLPGVGKNLQDHLFVPMLWPYKADYGETLVDAETPRVQLRLVAEYLLTGGGPASVSVVQVGR